MVMYISLFTAGTRLLKEKDYIVVCYLGVSFWNESKVYVTFTFKHY